ncbi:EAL domain-containing protein [Halomonas organivorans]
MRARETALSWKQARRWGLALATLCWLNPAAGTETLRIGVYDNPPKLVQAASGAPSGIFGDVLAAIAEREGWTLEAVPCRWQDCLTRLADGEIDLLPDVAWSATRDERLDFHRDAVLHSWSQVYQAPGAGLESMLDLAGRRIAVLQGSVQQRYLMELADGFGIEVDWQPVGSFEAGFRRVADGGADAAVGNHHYGDRHAQPFGLQPTPILFQPARLYFAAAEGRHAGVLDRLDAYLEDWKRRPDSPWFEIQRRWMPEEARPPLVPGYLWWTLGILAGGAALLGLVSLLLRRQVRARTRALHASERRLATILDSVDAYIYIKDASGRYEYVNRRVADFFGIAPEALIGRTDDTLFDADTARQLRHHDLRVLRQGERVAVEETTQPPGETEPRTFFSVKLPLDTPGEGPVSLCGISTDLTEYRRIQQRNHHLAHFDTLTGLPNRSLLFDRLRHAMAGRSRSGLEGGLLLLDLDRFKTLNETLGLDGGDRLLRQIASRLAETLDETDTLSRPGGDEFAVILEDLSADRDTALTRLNATGQVLLERLSRPFGTTDAPLPVTASIGAVPLSAGEGRPERLWQCAELALYEAKARGRARLHFFDPAMQARVEHRARRERDLRRALEEDRLTLHLQPQVTGDGHITGMEALVRWHHPEEGWIPPGDFIPVAEASDLIIDLGERILSLACRQLATWAEQGCDRVLAVNISPRQFHRPDFADRLACLLEAYGIEPSRLELEITESLLIQDTESAAQHMAALRRRGVRFALDDFGTGYASLAYLRRLPLDRLKIDQGFVSNLLEDPNDAAIVRTILALGDSLGLEVIAEGVETRAQYRHLDELGCRHFQGYFFGRPAPPSHWDGRVLVDPP